MQGWYEGEIIDASEDPDSPGMLQHFITYPDGHQGWTRLDKWNFKVIKKLDWKVRGSHSAFERAEFLC